MSKALRIMALLLALVCVFTIVDPAVYAMGQTETGQQAEQMPEPDKQPDDDGDAVPDKEPGEEDEPEPDEEDMAEEEDGVSENAAASVELFLAVNGVWKNVDTRSVNLDASTKRYYITAAELESVYGAYGFSTEVMSADQRIFPHTDKKNYDTIWADAKPYQTESGEWRVPLSTNIDNYLYYLPGNVAGSASFFAQKASRNDAAVLADNTFYTVSVSDTTGTEEKTGTYYAFNGNAFSITLSRHDEHEWRITNPDTGDIIKPDTTEAQTDGKVKYTFNAVTCPIKIMLADESKTTYMIHYNAATLDATKEQLGQIAVSQQTVLKDGCIDGQAELEVKLSLGEGDEYMLRRPDEEQFTVLVSGDKGKKFIYFFDGWRVAGSNELIPADTILTAANILRYEENGALTLNAVWKAKDANGRISTVNFYVNLYCEIADNLSNGFSSKPESNFTNSVYYTGIFGTDNVPVGSDLNCMLLAPATAAENAYATDTALREMTNTPLDSGVILESVPSDEEVFRQIRNSGTTIKVEGVAIPSTRLTTDHFKVRWYVLKYEKGDGWHVDGILVAKEGHLRVRKSFLGDSAGIAQITDPQNDFEIAVRHTPLTGNAITEDYELTLVPKAEEKREGKLGYTSYDEATKTYKWILTGNAVDFYTLSELNYTSKTQKESEWQSSSRYIISGTGATADDRAWQVYNGTGVRTRMESYATDVPETAYKTLTFRNTYVRSGMLTLYKEDSFTHKGLSGVRFTLAAADEGTELVLYRKPNTSQYSTDENAGLDGYTAEVTDKTLETDAYGNVYLELMEGSYKLIEEVPSGYDGAAEIGFSVDGSGNLTALSAHDKDGKDVTDKYVSGLNTARLTVRNDSKLLTTVTAVTDWADSIPENQRVPVQVELWCGGVRMTGSEYRQTLSADNNWSYVWSNLPLFADGTVAKYTLRESMIGDTAYDPKTNGDGYADYDVTYDDAKYREGNDGEYNDEPTWVDEQGSTHYANHVLLRSHNSLDNGLVDVNVTKQWRDGNDQDGLRPASITVKLLRNGQETGSTLTLNADNKWSGIFRGLRAYERGEQLVYTVAEVAVPGYTSTITGTAATGFNIMNTHSPERLTVAGAKTWDGDAGHETARPESITVTLYADGEKLDEKTVSPDAGGNWSWSFTNLPKCSAGREIVYTVSEAEVKDYTAEVKGYDITNHYSPAVTPTPTATPSPTPTGTPTPTPTATASPVPTAVPTDGPAPSHTPRPTPTPRPTGNPGTDPKTGDESNIALWAGMGLISIAAAAGVVLLIKKRGKGK